MRYPMLYNGLVFRRINEDEFQVLDYLVDEEYYLPADLVRFARKLDGKRDPYTVDRRLTEEDVDEYLAILDEYELLRESRILSTGLGSILYSLWFPKRTIGLCLLAKGYAALISLLWLPALLLGGWGLTHGFVVQAEAALVPGMILGVVIGAFLHEFGHLCEGICHGAYVFEMGVMLRSFMPGAYVLMKSDHLKSSKARLRIYAAGIKANLFFAGLCGILAVYVFPFLSVPLLASAVGNAVVGLTNVAFVDGMDGMIILSEYFGIHDLGDYSKSVVWSEKKRKELWARGVNGYAIFAFCLTIRMIQVVTPLLYMLIVVWCLEVFGWIG